MKEGGDKAIEKLEQELRALKTARNRYLYYPDTSPMAQRALKMIDADIAATETAIAHLKSS